ncbi:MAG: hypothetical protein WCQ20_13740 [Synechococcaceae cyanobacterium ELA739]
MTDSATLPTLQNDDEDLGDLLLEVLPGNGRRKEINSQLHLAM